MGFGIHIRIHPDGDGGDFVFRARHLFEQVEFGLRFDVEGIDALVEGVAQLVPCLADAGKHHFARVAAGGEHPVQFSAGHDIEARSQACHDVQHREIGVGFHRVADQMIVTGEGAIEGVPVAFQGGTGIDIAWRAHGGGYGFYRYVFGIEFAVAIGEMVHGGLLIGCRLFGAGGRGSRCFVRRFLRLVVGFGQIQIILVAAAGGEGQQAGDDQGSNAKIQPAHRVLCILLSWEPAL